MRNRLRSTKEDALNEVEAVMLLNARHATRRAAKGHSSVSSSMSNFGRKEWRNVHERQWSTYHRPARGVVNLYVLGVEGRKVKPKEYWYECVATRAS